MSSLASTLRTHCQSIPFRRNRRGPSVSSNGANHVGNEMTIRENAVTKADLALPSAPVVSLPNSLPSASALAPTAVHSDVAIPESLCANPSTSRKPLSDEPSIDNRSTVNDTIFAGYYEQIFEEEIPSCMGHYDREHDIPNKTSTFSIPPMLFDFEGNKGPGEVLPSGWKEYTHSDGKPYFWHDAFRTITEEWIYDYDLRKTVTDWASILNTVLSRHPHLSEVKDWHLVIRIVEYSTQRWPNDDCRRCQYYFANHDNESLFWLSDFDMKNHLTAIRGPVTLSQIYHFLRQEYWHHMYLFADTHAVSNAQWMDANRMVVNAYFDVTISKTSTVAHSAVELEAMTKCLSQAEKCNASEVAAAVLRSLLSNRFLNYHGQRGARTNREESVFGDDPGQAQSTFIFKLLTPFLFYAPVVHLDVLNKFWVDGLAIQDQWVTLIERCTSEWSEHTVYATILLNANVAFLAIPLVDESMTKYRGSVTQVLSALSVVSALGSILVGLLMGRYHRTKKHIPIEDINAYITRHYKDNSKLGFEWLAITYSIPYALLMWAIMLFWGAFFSMCWESSTRSVRISGVAGFALAFAISVLCIYRFWEGDQWTTWAFGWLPQCLKRGQDGSPVLECISSRLTSIWRDKWKRGSCVENITENPPV